MVLVAVGTTFHGSLAPAPVEHPPKKTPPAVVYNPDATRSLLLRRQRKVPFKLEVPTLLAINSAPDTEGMPIRTYKIDGDNRAVRLSFAFRTAATPSTGVSRRPTGRTRRYSSDANFDHTIKGRHYRFYWNGSDLHMIALYENGATYWVVNTLLDSLSPSTMMAIAKGLQPLHQVKK